MPRIANWEDYVLLGTVGTCVVMILCAFLVRTIGTPEEQMQRKLEKLANEYYITYLYPRLLGDLKSEPSSMLAQYSDGGVATTYLRQLLHFNNDQFIELAPTFQQFGCDTNNTSVRYFPIEPYGPKDYEIKFDYHCAPGVATK